MARATESFLIEKAYLMLLSLPLGSVRRAMIQPALAALRDDIARETGRSSKQIQNAYEALAKTGSDLNVDADELGRGFKITFLDQKK